MRSLINRDFMSRYQQFILDAPSSIEGGLSSQATLETGWHSIIEDYTRRSLTKNSDRLAAVHGLATALHEAMGFTYLAGLWREHLQVDLIWSRAPKSLSWPIATQNQRLLAGLGNGRSPDAPAPSWSWASLNLPVFFNRGHDGEMPVLDGTLIKARVEGSPSRQTGILTIEGNARVAFVADGPSGIKAHGLSVIEAEGPDGTRRLLDDVNWIPDHNVPIGTMIWFLAVVRSYSKYERKDRKGWRRSRSSLCDRVFCLALVPAHELLQGFRRVGLAVWSGRTFEGEDGAVDGVDQNSASGDEAVVELQDSFALLTLRQQHRQARANEGDGPAYKLLRHEGMLWRPERIKARIV
jgi:hypothetical protein